MVTMNNFTLSDISRLADYSLLEAGTGNAWLDARYQEQVLIIGHTNPYYRLFFTLAQILKPEFVVELGSWQATAAAHFALGNPDGLVLTVDIHREDKIAQQRCYEAQEYCKNLTYINKWIGEAVEDVASYGKKIDILFCDGWHDFEHLSDDWNNYRPLLNDNALVIFDDITTAYNFEGMVEFWEQLEGEKFLNSDIHPGIPMGFLRFEREVKQEIIFGSQDWNDEEFQDKLKKAGWESPNKITKTGKRRGRKK